MQEELLLMLAAAATPDDLVEMLEKDIKRYQSSSGKQQKEAFDRLQLTCVIVMSKRLVPNMESVRSVIKEMEKTKSMIDLLDPKKNLQN
mgnify:CR=1 FL=1